MDTTSPSNENGCLKGWKVPILQLHCVQPVLIALTSNDAGKLLWEKKKTNTNPPWWQRSVSWRLKKWHLRWHCHLSGCINLQPVLRPVIRICRHLHIALQHLRVVKGVQESEKQYFQLSWKWWEKASFKDTTTKVVLPLPEPTTVLVYLHMSTTFQNTVKEHNIAVQKMQKKKPNLLLPKEFCFFSK